MLTSALLALALLQPLHARLQRRAHGLRHGMAAATAAAAAARAAATGAAAAGAAAITWAVGRGYMVNFDGIDFWVLTHLHSNRSRDLRRNSFRPEDVAVGDYAVLREDVSRHNILEGDDDGNFARLLGKAQ